MTAGMRRPAQLSRTRCPLSRGAVASRRSETKRVTGTVGSRAAGWASDVEMMSRGRVGTAAGEDFEAGVTARP